MNYLTYGVDKKSNFRIFNVVQKVDYSIFDIKISLIDKLLIAAITYKKPVYIACYSEVWGEPCKRPSKKMLQPKVKKSKQDALQNAVDQAWAQLKAAKQPPMIFAGVEILRHGLSDLLQK